MFEDCNGEFQALWLRLLATGVGHAMCSGLQQAGAEHGAAKAISSPGVLREKSSYCPNKDRRHQCHAGVTSTRKDKGLDVGLALSETAVSEFLRLPVQVHSTIQTQALPGSWDE
jgi:alcohol dehydrogenase class IV